MFIRGELPDHAAIFTVSPLTERPGPSDAGTLYVNSADFNGDGNLGTDADTESFFRVLAGGAC